MIPNLIILYVDNPIVSSKFYQKLFNKEPDVMLPAWALSWGLLRFNQRLVMANKTMPLK